MATALLVYGLAKTSPALSRASRRLGLSRQQHSQPEIERKSSEPAPLRDVIIKPVLSSLHSLRSRDSRPAYSSLPTTQETSPHGVQPRKSSLAQPAEHEVRGTSDGGLGALSAALAEEHELHRAQSRRYSEPSTDWVRGCECEVRLGCCSSSGAAGMLTLGCCCVQVECEHVHRWLYSQGSTRAPAGYTTPLAAYASAPAAAASPAAASPGALLSGHAQPSDKQEFTCASPADLAW